MKFPGMFQSTALDMMAGLSRAPITTTTTPEAAEAPKAADQRLMSQCWRVAGGSREEIAWALYLVESKMEREKICRS